MEAEGVPGVEADVEVVESLNSSSADDLKNEKVDKVDDDEEEFDLVSH
jgi:hypothetical protein